MKRIITHIWWAPPNHTGRWERHELGNLEFPTVVRALVQTTPQRNKIFSYARL